MLPAYVLLDYFNALRNQTLRLYLLNGTLQQEQVAMCIDNINKPYFQIEVPDLCHINSRQETKLAAWK